MRSIRGAVTAWVTATAAVLLSGGSVGLLLLTERTIFAGVERELSATGMGACHTIVDEVLLRRGLDWDEAIDGPDPFSSLDRIDSIRFPADFEVSGLERYEWCVVRPNGEVVGVSNAFPETHSCPPGIGGARWSSCTMPDGARGRVASVVSWLLITEEMDDEEIVREHYGPTAIEDWRPGARPGFEEYGRYERPLECLLARSVEGEYALIRRYKLALIGVTLATALAVFLVARGVAAHALRGLTVLGQRFSALDAETIDTPIEVSDCPTELAPVVAHAEGSRARLANAIDRERRFCGDAAHELMTPLAGLRAILEASLLPLALSAEARAAAASCHAVTLDMQSTLEAMLSLAVAESMSEPPEPVDIAVLLSGAIGDLEAEWGRRALDVRVAVSGASTVLGWEPLVRRIIENVLGNAASYAPTGTQVDVSVRERGASVFVQVANDLSRPVAGLADRALQPFWRAAPDAEGGHNHAGLGLSISQRCARAMGGTLKVRVTDSRFAVELRLPVPSTEREREV